MEFLPVTERHEKVLIIGGGESLIDFDFSKTTFLSCAIITVNNVVFHVPRSDYWITVDPMRDDLPQRAMREQKPYCKYFCAFPDLDKTPQDYPYYKKAENVHLLERIIPETYSLQTEKNKITTGDSIFGALNLAYHFEAKKIAMIGVDVYGFGHWYNKGSPYNGYNQKHEDFEAYKKRIPPIYETSVKQFNERGCTVVNGSPKSKIECFWKMTPDEAIKFLS